MVGHRILKTQVWHKRTMPKTNEFTYSVFQTLLDMNQLKTLKKPWGFGVNQKRIVNFQNKDHGLRDGSCPLVWVKNLLKQNSISGITDIRLITIPRTLGYLFNPVSFWLCMDATRMLIAVIAQVNNTFCQTHSYVCRKKDLSPILKSDWIIVDKQFHVSPFMERKGEYEFNFDITPSEINIKINYTVGQEPLLLTAMCCEMKPFSSTQFYCAVLTNLFGTFKVISLIHYQALKLWFKKQTYRRLPKQKTPHFSVSHSHKKSKET